jgi:putative flippase GtrA
MSRNFSLYFVIGISGFLIDFILFNIFVYFFDFSFVISNVMSSFIGFNNNFFLNAFFNFKKKDRIIYRYFSYFCVALVGIFLSSLIIYLSVQVFMVQASLSKFIAGALVFSIQYLMNKRITFAR